MSALAKVLVVLVLVLSVGFAAAEIVLYGKRESYGKKYVDEAKRHADTQQKLDQAQRTLADMTRGRDQDNEKSKSQILALNTSLAAEKTRTADLSRQADNLTTSVQSLSDGAKQLELGVANRDNTIQELRGVLSERDEAIKENLANIGQLQKAVAERDGTIGDLQYELTETKKAYAKLSESEDQLEAILAELVRRGVDVPPVPLPIISGRVVRVDVEHSIAIIDKGRKAGVKPASEFTIYNEQGYVAQIVIQEVQPDVSLGQIRVLADNKQVQQGDVATTAIR